jgi:hypothetical protein
MIGGTKAGEIERSCDLFEQICEGTAASCETTRKEQWPELALAFIYDSQYDRADIKMMLDCWEARRKRKRSARQKCDHKWTATKTWLIDKCSKCGEERA